MSDAVQTMYDGKRHREIWVNGVDRDGDTTDLESLVKQIPKSTNKGHPTWKLFVGGIDPPFVIDSHEIPHFTYLDDKAAYEILMSRLYAGTRLGRFWPYDFTAHGQVRQGRPNRGRAAILEEENGGDGQRNATWGQGHNNIYTFKGGPMDIEVHSKGSLIAETASPSSHTGTPSGGKRPASIISPPKSAPKRIRNKQMTAPKEFSSSDIVSLPIETLRVKFAEVQSFAQAAFGERNDYKAIAEESQKEKALVEASLKAERKRNGALDAQLEVKITVEATLRQELQTKVQEILVLKRDLELAVPASGNTAAATRAGSKDPPTSVSSTEEDRVRSKAIVDSLMDSSTATATTMKALTEQAKKSYDAKVAMEGALVDHSESLNAIFSKLLHDLRGEIQKVVSAHAGLAVLLDQEEGVLSQAGIQVRDAATAVAPGLTDKNGDVSMEMDEQP
ncbi:hypothetical protein K402DRAFT_450072 [Aulographum hederae CBS 113979]|uniref:Uncharacterized protein n=1 Tax=Aulographum hederae CBS 113979 TaxID=1176131 RepID=A0A6G1HFU6_9PEZI|nr:hypothetical protein K402DRAFT_450072 [Aulographum hederae CBS 113979]